MRILGTIIRTLFNVNYFFPWTTIKIPVSPGERM